MTTLRFARLRCLTFAAAGLWLAVPGASAANSPWYLQARAGEANLAAGFGRHLTKTFDSDESAYSFEVGYQVNRYLAIQAGLHDLGKHTGLGSPCAEDASGCIERLASEFGLCVQGRQCLEILVPVGGEVTGTSLSVVPRWPITDRLSVAGKLGWMAWETEITGLFYSGDRETFSDDDLLTGLAVHYAFPNGLGLLLEYESLDLDLDVASAGLSWRF